MGKSDLGLCPNCGYTTQITGYGSGFRCSQCGTEYLVIDSRYTKLINHKGFTGQQRLERYRKLRRHENIPHKARKDTRRRNRLIAAQYGSIKRYYKNRGFLAQSG